MFRPFLACISHISCRPIRPNMARFWPNQPGLARIEADSAQIELRRHESSRVGANPRKKKCGCGPTRGQPRLVPHPRFLGFNTNLTNSHNFQLTTKKNPLNSTKVFCFLGKKQFLCRNNMVVTAKFPNLTPR